MTVLLTGGSGFLGSHIAEQLSRAGRKVRALVRRSSDTAFLRSLPNVELAEGSVGDLESLIRAAAGVEAIVHAAGLLKARNPEELVATNVTGTANALEAARRTRGTLRRFVLVSSQAAGGPSEDGRPVPVTATPRPVTHYGESKLAAELVALRAKDDIPVTIIRPPAIYGPRDRETFAFFKAVNTGILPVLGSRDTKISIIYGSDAAIACICAIDRDVPSGSVYYVEDGTTKTFAELALAIEGALGRRAWLRVPLPRRIVELAAMGSELYGRLTKQAVMLTRDKCNELFAPHWVCDGSDAQRELGWTPAISFDEGTRLAAAWYRNAGWL